MKKLQDLKVQCEVLGLHPTPTKHRLNPDRYELSVNDCVSAIQKYYLDKLVADGEQSDGLCFMLKHKTPMLAALLSNQSDELQNEVWSEYSTDWEFECKYSGVRLLLFYDNTSYKLEVYSRSLDDETLLPVDYRRYFSDNLALALRENNFPSFIIDTELVFNSLHDIDINTYFEDIVVNQGRFTNDEVKFVLLDCLSYDEDDLTNLMYSTRKQKLMNFLDKDLYYAFDTVLTKTSDQTKEDFYYQVIDQGYEGVIVKNLKSHYEFRRSSDWLKIKPSVSTGVNLTDTLDAYVSGYLVGTDNMINALLFSINVDVDGCIVSDKLFCKLSVSRELSIKLTRFSGDGSIILNEGFYHHVAEFVCDGLNKNLEMIHPRLVVWRLDKSFDKCVYDQSYLSSMVIEG